jgi:hypothetical protein
VDVDPSQLDHDGRIALLDETLAELHSAHGDGGRLLVGGEEALLLWDATVDAFAAGIWVATILCAQATCERSMAGLVSLRELPGYGMEGPKGWEQWGLGKLIAHVRTQGWVPGDLLDDVWRLCEARKPYGHWRGPMDPGTLGRQVAEHLVACGWDVDPLALRERLLSQEALRSARTALRLYYGDFARGPFEV